MEEPSAPTLDNEEDDAQYIRQAFVDYIDSNPLANQYHVCMHCLLLHNEGTMSLPVLRMSEH